MKGQSRVRNVIRLAAMSAGVAAGAYAAMAGLAWYRYGRAGQVNGDDVDRLLDRFMPVYDVVERHHVRIAAPAATTFAAAEEQALFDLPLVHAIFRARELVLGATPAPRDRRRGLLAEVLALGWGVLAEVPGREVVVGAFTKPWDANPTFHALRPDQFAAFCEPGYVKIAWTLRAEAVTESVSVFRTETRAWATDTSARSRFRRYWALASPGIGMIRWLSLLPLKREAERRARERS